MLGMKTYLGWKVDFLQPAGEPAYAGPDSVSWRVFKNPIALGVGGIAAVLLEFADASGIIPRSRQTRSGDPSAPAWRPWSAFTDRRARPAV